MSDWLNNFIRFKKILILSCKDRIPEMIEPKADKKEVLETKDSQELSEEEWTNL